MTQRQKTFQKMRNNPLDWRIEDLQTIADNLGIVWRQQGTSHVVFIRGDGQTLPIPAKRPIKPIYIRKFIVFVEEWSCE